MSLEFGKLCLRNYDVGPNDPILCDRPLSLLGYFFEYSPDPPQFTDTWLNGTAERTIREGLKRINEVNLSSEEASIKVFCRIRLEHLSSLMKTSHRPTRRNTHDPDFN